MMKEVNSIVQQPNRGYFVSLEGVEGAGKSTAINTITDYLTAQQISYVVTREPGGTSVGEAIRHVLLTTYDQPMCPDTELLLLFAGRMQNVQQVIYPALARGQWVVADRFVDASFAYQGGGRGLSKERISALADWALAGFLPDLTLLLDTAIDVGRSRIAKRPFKDRIEREDSEFFQRVRAVYLDLASQMPERIRLIDAEQSLNSVASQLIAALQPLLQRYEVQTK